MTEEQAGEETSVTEENISLNSILLKERFEICLDAPLPELDTNGAKAYEVKDNISPQRKLFALVCDTETAPRSSYFPYMKSIDVPNILKLVEFGVVSIGDKGETTALVYNKPTGSRADIFTQPPQKMTHERFKSLALSLLSACEVLNTFGLTHRAIRLDNIFYKDSSQSELVLGDCLACFPSFHQPAYAETIENMLCEPFSRGGGLLEHDIYNAGVVLLELALGHKITTELPLNEQIRQKLKHSSFSFLSNNEKIHNQIVTVLRSLLDDYAENRCTHSQLLAYYEGKTSSFSSSDTVDRSNRALVINGEKCYTRKSAALAMLANPDFGIEVIQSGKLLEWVKLGLENEKLYTKIEKQILAEKENPDKSLLLARICIFLDYSFPLKYGDGFLFPNGLAKTIFYNKKKNLPLTGLQTLITTDIVKLWYQEQPSSRAPGNASEFKMYVSRNDYGYGFDRIMYDFDEDLPCISPLVNKFYVNNISKLLRALDRFKGDYDTLPFDKNIIAYLRCKMGKKIDGIITDINANQDVLRLSAIMRLYASIQNKNGPAQASNLCHWLVNIAKPLIQNYHNIKYRKFLEQELLKISKNGKIIEIIEILENEEARNRDKSDYSDALKLANSLIAEKTKILSGDSKIEEEARDLAYRFTSIAAVLTMLSTFVFSLLYWMIK